MKIKHPKLKILHRRAWKVISEYIRKAPANKKGMVFCFTCGKKDHYKNMDCGHYIHRNSLDFDEVNLKIQCTYCNRFLHGNLGVYAERLIAEYGEEAIIALRQRANVVKKFTITELEDLILTYRQKIKELN